MPTSHNAANTRRLLAETNAPQALECMLEVLGTANDPRLLSAVLSAIAAYGDPRVSQRVNSQLEHWPIEVQQDAYRLLASRASWALDLVRDVKAGRIKKDLVPFDAVERLALLEDETLKTEFASLWPSAGSRSAMFDPDELQRVTAALCRARRTHIADA